MKALAINGSPRRGANTATMLRHALAGAASRGAETKLVHLRGLSFSGCASCFACKRKGARTEGRCALRDDATPLLDEALGSDVVVLGSPMYLGGVTGAMKSLLERLVFPSLSYDVADRRCFEGRIATGFAYTMGMPHDLVERAGYPALFEANRSYLELLGGPSAYVVAADAYQFDDYARYAASNFDEGEKARVRAERFPRECEEAYAMAVALCESSEVRPPGPVRASNRPGKQRPSTPRAPIGGGPGGPRP